MGKLLAAVLSLICACAPPHKDPRLLTSKGYGGSYERAPAVPKAPEVRLTANDPGRAPMIVPPGSRAKRLKAKGRRRLAVGEEELSIEDMGADDVDDSSDTAKEQKPKEKPEPEPEGPLVQRKRRGPEAAPPDVNVKLSDIKPLKMDHGRVRFPPPPEGAEDEEELDEAMAAKNKKLADPKGGDVKISAQGELSVDPSTLGSYHVQVSSTPYFRRNIIDTVYGFGADIYLEDDVEAAGGVTGKYYIRWALIDLLDMEHPFHKTKYFTYVAPVRPEGQEIAAPRPAGPSPR